MNLDLVNGVVQGYRTATSCEEKKEAYLVLCNSTIRVCDPLTRFKEETSSKRFKFWDKYIEMVLLLLKFIRAEREGDWELRLKATTEMIPHFFALDQLNYSRWLAVYIMDMRHLHETAPGVYNELVTGNLTVSR